MLSLKSSIFVAALAMVNLASQVDGHGYLLLPETKFTTDKKNFYATWVNMDKIPPESDYWTGDAEKNANNFKKNYKAGNWATLKDFILTNQVMTDNYENRPSGGTLECGFSIPDAEPQPLPDHIEYGNYRKDIIHPGPCEAWCDDEIIVPFQEDCRVYQGIDIPYDKSKCEGKSRLTFYWLATHFGPFQVYTSCVPLQGAVASEANSTTPTNAPTITTTVPATEVSGEGTQAPTPATVAPPTSTTAPSAGQNCRRSRKL